MAKQTKETTIADLQAQIDAARADLDKAIRANPFAQHEAAISALESQLNAAHIDDKRKQLDAALQKQHAVGEDIAVKYAAFQAADKAREQAEQALDDARGDYKVATGEAKRIAGELRDLGCTDIPPIPNVG